MVSCGLGDVDVNYRFGLGLVIGCVPLWMCIWGVWLGGAWASPLAVKL